MPTPITVTANLIDLTGNTIQGYMTANIVSPTGVYDLFVTGLGIIAPKGTTSTIGSTVSVSIWGNDVVVDMVDSRLDTYYIVTLFNTNNIAVWTAAYLFTGSGPINLVGYPSLTTLPSPPTQGPIITGVSSVNLLQGAVTLSAGAGIALTTLGNTITVTNTPRPFDVASFTPGPGINAQVLLRIGIPRAVTFLAGATLSIATASIAATGSTTFTLKKNGVSFATTVFAPSGTSGTWTQASDAVFAAGDILEIDGPATADATLANIGITLAGTRN